MPLTFFVALNHESNFFCFRAKRKQVVILSTHIAVKKRKTAFLNHKMPRPACRFASFYRGHLCQVEAGQSAENPSGKKDQVVGIGHSGDG
jgi:hypothetical protein